MLTGRNGNGRAARMFPFALTCLALLSPGARADSDAPITLLYYERPPFFFTAPDGSPHGTELDPAAQAFQTAGVRYVWQRAPLGRILSIVKANREQDCVPGFYKTAERASYAQFTEPMHWDPGLQGLMRAESILPDEIAAKDLLARTEIHVLVRKGASYGPYVDSLLAGLPAERIHELTDELPVMAKMIVAGRGDIMFAQPEETRNLIAESGLPADSFRIVKFPDANQPSPTYILCSRKVPADIIDRLNKAIAASRD